MDYIYDSSRKAIRELNNESKEVLLSYIEGRFVEIMSNNATNSWEEIGKYVYNCNYNEKVYDDIRNLKKELCRKVNLNIKNQYGRGFMLKDKVRIR